MENISEKTSSQTPIESCRIENQRERNKNTNNSRKRKGEFNNDDKPFISRVDPVKDDEDW